jgi:hypothetical protein
MADTRPTPVSFFQAVRLCWQLLFAPQRFVEAEQKDIATRNCYTGGASPPHRAVVVRAAFFKSLALVVVSSAMGFAAAHALHTVGRCATGETVAWAQIVGASLLLWGTLFVRGWEIQSYSGVLLTERVNQWLYRALYCLGTAVLVFSLAFPACKQ